MNLTTIDYLDRTWNPLAMRCTRVSPACDNCWHLRMADRKAGNPKLSDQERQASAGLIPPVLMPDRIGEPLRLKKPQRIGVQFMGDLFHEAVEWNQLFAIFQVMGMAPQHQFLVKTKRPERMAKELMGDLGLHLQRQDWCKKWPLPNVWAGVTIESQDYEHRGVELLQTPAAIRFVSVEPGLSVVDLQSYLYPYQVKIGDTLLGSKLNFVVVGGESGPHARPLHPDIPRKLRDDCVAAGVPFWFKSWGEWFAYPDDYAGINYADESTGETKGVWYKGGGRFTKNIEWSEDGKLIFARVGKKDAGRALDGRTWEEVPEVGG